MNHWNGLTRVLDDGRIELDTNIVEQTIASGWNLTLGAIDGGDDFVGVCGPCEGLRLALVSAEEAVDGGLGVDDGVEDAAFREAWTHVEEASTALSLDHEVG